MRNLTLALLLTLSAAVAATPDESKQMADGYIYYQNGNWQRCVDTFGPLLKQNPALRDEMAKPTVSNDKAGMVLDECQASLARSKVTDTPEYQAAYSTLNTAMNIGQTYKDDNYSGRTEEQFVQDNYNNLKKCIDGISEAIKKYPEFRDFTNIKDGPTAAQVLASCQQKFGPVKAAYDKQVKQAAQANAARYAQLAAAFQKAQQLAQSAIARPEKTNTDILLKYRDLKSAVDNLESVALTFNSYDEEPNANITMIGNLPVQQFKTKWKATYAAASAALKKIQPRADKAFDQQDAQVQANMPKLVAGDKLAVFKRFGIPSNWAGGPTFSKYGIYSGDGVAIAKDIASSTMWYYADRGNGCDYKYYFSKNTVSKVEKPLGC